MSCRKGVWKFVSFMGYNLALVRLDLHWLSVVKLDYGKVSAIGVSGCASAL